MRELEFKRDIESPVILQRLNELYKAYFKFFEQHPDREQELLGSVITSYSIHYTKLYEANC